MDINNKPLKFKPNKTYNLMTGRWVNNPPEDLESIEHDGYRICGCPLAIQTFNESNHYISNITPITSNDIELIECYKDEDFDNFALIGCEITGKVTHVIDGDTYDIFGVINLNSISNKYYIKRKKAGVKTLKQLQSCENDSDGKMVLKLRSRLFGFDTYEKNLEEGVKAKEFTSSFLNDKYIKGIIKGIDFKGRFLVDMYVWDDSRFIKFSELLRENNFGCQYFGGTKELPQHD